MQEQVEELQLQHRETLEKKLRQIAHSGISLLCKNPDRVRNNFPHPQICGYARNPPPPLGEVKAAYSEVS
jgi:hypothetical protein